MWSSSSEDQQQHHKCLNKNLTAKSSSKSSSTTSSSFSLSNNHHPQNFRLHKTMEEVWKDIHLSSLNDKTSSSRDIDPQNTTSSATNNFGGTIVQDFLARPFSNDPPIALGHDSPAPPPPPPHVTMLTLNSGLKFNFFNSLRQNTHSNQKTISQVGSLNRSFEAYANGRKRNNESNNNSSDQKSKRMIKNRESAARSRARKQAYTSELEREIAHLMKENATLKNQQQQQLSLAAAAQLPKKNSLYRTSTAPF